MGSLDGSERTGMGSVLTAEQAPNGGGGGGTLTNVTGINAALVTTPSAGVRQVNVPFGAAPNANNTTYGSAKAGTATTLSRRDHEHTDFVVRVPSLGDRVTDMTAAINGAIAIIQTLSANAGGCVELGYGPFFLAGKVVYPGNGITVRGQGQGNATEVILDGSASTDTIDSFFDLSDTGGCRLLDMTITASISLTSTSPIAVKVAGASSQRLVNTASPTNLGNTVISGLDMVGCHDGIVVKDTTTGAFNVHILNCNVQSCNGGSCVWINTFGGMISVVDCTLTTMVPPSTSEAFAGVRVTAAGDVTLINVNNYQCKFGLRVDPGNGAKVQRLASIGCIFDTNSKNNVFLQASGTGLISQCLFTNTWCAGANIGGGGTGDDGHNVFCGVGCDDVRFGDCHSYQASSVGACFLATTGAQRIFFDSCSAGGGHIGFGAAGTTTVVVVRNCDIGQGIFSGTDIGLYVNGVGSGGAANVWWFANSIHATTPTSGTPTAQANNVTY